MTDWTKIANNSMDKTEKELASGIEKLMSADIGKLFPVPADATKVRELIQAIRVKTAYNERVAAFKAISVTLGEDVLKIVKKAMLCFVLCLIVGQAHAADGSLFNFGELFKSARAGYGIDQHGQKSTIFYAAIMTYHTTEKIDLVSFNIGYEGVLKRPTTMIGVRLDNIIPLMFDNEWGKKHVSVSSFPTFEGGPFLSMWPSNEDNLWHMTVRYGLGLAIGF